MNKSTSVEVVRSSTLCQGTKKSSTYELAGRYPYRLWNQQDLANGLQSLSALVVENLESAALGIQNGWEGLFQKKKKKVNPSQIEILALHCSKNNSNKKKKKMGSGWGGEGPKFGYTGKDKWKFESTIPPPRQHGKLPCKGEGKQWVSTQQWNTARKTHFSPAAPRLASWPPL